MIYFANSIRFLNGVSNQALTSLCISTRRQFLFCIIGYEKRKQFSVGHKDVARFSEVVNDINEKNDLNMFSLNYVENKIKLNIENGLDFLFFIND